MINYIVRLAKLFIFKLDRVELSDGGGGGGGEGERCQMASRMNIAELRTLNRWVGLLRCARGHVPAFMGTSFQNFYITSTFNR